MESMKKNILLAVLIGFVVAFATYPLSAENISEVPNKDLLDVEVHMIPYDSGEESSYLAAAHGG